MTESIHNSMDFIDSRDVESRIDDLEGDRQILVEIIEALRDQAEHETPEDADALAEIGDELFTAKQDLEAWDEEEGKELEVLKQLREDAMCLNWYLGETLIADSYFPEYARQTATDIYGFDPDVWPFNEIDWEHAAEALHEDYREVDFEGETYWVRA